MGLVRSHVSNRKPEISMSKTELVVTCPCGVEIRSDSRRELVVMVQEHAADVHDMHLDEEQVMDMAHPA